MSKSSSSGNESVCLQSRSFGSVCLESRFCVADVKCVEASKMVLVRLAEILRKVVGCVGGLLSAVA